MKKLSDLLRVRNEELIELYRKKEAGEEIELQFIPTGLPSLDSRGLLEKGILTIVGGDPGSGKTAWALKFLKAAAEYGYNPKAFIFEDPLPYICDRISSASIGESAFKLRRISIEDEGITERLRAVSNTEDWTKHVGVEDTQQDTAALLAELDKTCTESTGLVIVDYAQAFDAEDNEKSVERVIARLAWGLNQLAKKKNIAVVLFSQLKTEVRERGKKYFDNYRWNNQDPGPTDYAAVEGYRPISGDLQWSSALYQRAKQILYIFRPGAWLRAHGIAAKDDIVHAMIDKGNYGPNKEIVEFAWNGALTTISEKRKKNA